MGFEAGGGGGTNRRCCYEGAIGYTDRTAYVRADFATLADPEERGEARGAQVRFGAGVGYRDGVHPMFAGGVSPWLAIQGDRDGDSTSCEKLPVVAMLMLGAQFTGSEVAFVAQPRIQTWVCVQTH